jgi:hypothetical protein
MEGPTTNQHTEKAREDLSALKSLSNGECIIDDPTTDLLQGEIPKERTEGSSQGYSAAERPSKDTIVKRLLVIKPAKQALPSSGELLGKTLFRYLRRTL